MNESYFIRKIDELGRVVIPIEIRKFLEIKEKDALELFLENDGIFIKKEKSHCVFCNSTNELTPFSGKKICKNCIEKLK